MANAPDSKVRRTKYGTAHWDFDQAAKFNAALGEAFVSWQHVETALFVLFHSLSEMNFENSSIIYFHIQSADNRKSLINKMCMHNLGQNVYAGPWKALMKRLEINLEARNSMAHFGLVGVNIEEVKLHTNFPYLMTANHLDHFASRSGNEKAITYETLIAKPTQFTRLADDIIVFCCLYISNWDARRESLPQDLAQALKKYPVVKNNLSKLG